MLADECGPYRSLILLLGIGGLRWGEAIALRPSDIDFLHRRILLHRNVVQGGGEFHLGTLKTNKNRTVVLPGAPVPVIEALAVSCEGKGRDELVWEAAKGGYLRRPSRSQHLVSPRGDPVPAGGPGVPAGDAAQAA